MKERTYRSNGKLMISGEYLVLAGAEALAVPVQFGQKMRVFAGKVQKKDESCTMLVQWLAYEKEFEWFRATLCGPELEIRDTNDDVVASALCTLLKQARRLNPKFLVAGAFVNVITKLEFDRTWGLGSSSTLVSNVAEWAQVDPYQLLFSTFGGSGYDIACARSEQPLIYRYCHPDTPGSPQPLVRTTDFHPPFADKLLFVYTGKKQNTRESLRSFDLHKVSKQSVYAISELTQNMAAAKNIDVFLEQMTEHERIISYETGMKPVKESLFRDFQGSVKSLGAWGGDFLLAATAGDAGTMTDYFRSRGYLHTIPYREMVKETTR